MRPTRRFTNLCSPASSTPVAWRHRSGQHRSSPSWNAAAETGLRRVSAPGDISLQFAEAPCCCSSSRPGRMPPHRRGRHLGHVLRVRLAHPVLVGDRRRPSAQLSSRAVAGSTSRSERHVAAPQRRFARSRWLQFIGRGRARQPRHERSASRATAWVHGSFGRRPARAAVVSMIGARRGLQALDLSVRSAQAVRLRSVRT